MIANQNAIIKTFFRTSSLHLKGKFSLQILKSGKHSQFKQ